MEEEKTVGRGMRSVRCGANRVGILRWRTSYAAPKFGPVPWSSWLSGSQGRLGFREGMPGPTGDLTRDLMMESNVFRMTLSALDQMSSKPSEGQTRRR